MCVWVCGGNEGGNEGGGEVRGLAGPIGVVGRLRVGLQASVKYIRYM